LLLIFNIRLECKEKNFKIGEAVKIKSPMSDHAHSEYCNCGDIIILLEREKQPNKKYEEQLKKMGREVPPPNKRSIWFNPRSTWICWHPSKGSIQVTESWMAKV